MCLLKAAANTRSKSTFESIPRHFVSFAGSFCRLERIIQRRLGRDSMGSVGAPQDSVATKPVNRQEILQHVEPEDLLSFGFIPEFIGRLPMLYRAG
jgi:ATP-dependent protease Clp ATPase subunit